MTIQPFPISDEALIRDLELPVHPRSFAFDFKPIAKRLCDLFQIDAIDIKTQPAKKVSSEEANALFSDATLYERISVPACTGHVFWITPKTSLKHFTLLALAKEEKEDELVSNDLLEGFKRFIAAELIFQVNQEKSPLFQSALIEQKELPSTGGYLYELLVNCGEKQLNCSLFLTDAFAKSFSQNVKSQAPLKIPKNIKQSVKTTVGLDIGHFSMNVEAFSKLKKGDFVVLDRCTLDPETKHGNLTLKLKEKSLFRAKLKEGNLKILDYPLDLAGDINAMDDIPPPPENPNNPPVHPNRNPVDPMHSDAQAPEESTPNLFETPEQKVDENIEQPWVDTDAANPPTPNPADEVHVEKPSAQKTQLSSRDIPLNVHIEVGRLQMPLERLLNLAPGQVLELGLHLDEGVSCMVGDKKVASGELVKLGETIGVRLIDVASTQT